MKLRDYQVALIKKATAQIGKFASPVVQLPTGGGKTVIAAAVIKSVVNESFPAWFVCHRKEILDQAVYTLTSHGIKLGVVASGREYDPRPLVHACSIGSLPGRIKDLRHPKLIVWDECHHMASPSWSAMHDAFPEAVHLGLTATPERLDGVGLRDWFTGIILGPSSRELIDQGYLSSFRAFAPSIPDLRGVKSVSGDYLRADVSKAMDRPTLVGDMVEHYQRIAPGQRALVFAASVEASKNVVERFLTAGISAAHIDASTASDQRRSIIDKFAAGEISVLSNVELFTEGFDCPSVDVVILLRPTKSRALYLQMVGRGMRTLPGKSATIILDHAGLIYAHGMPDDAVDWSLDGSQLREAKPLGSRLRRCPKCSAIHEWYVECVECGYAYSETDRSVDEVYGELVELKLQPGTERLTHFMQRVGVGAGVAYNWLKRGMPRNADGSVTISICLEWVAERAGYSPRPRGDGDNVTKGAFARMHGVHDNAIDERIKKGLPVNEDGLINVQMANNWLEDRPFRKVLSRKDIPLGHESLADFARRTGIKRDTVGLMTSGGFRSILMAILYQKRPING